MGERHSEYERDGNDFYVEPTWTVHLLLSRYADWDRVFDPCCGLGTIVDAARAIGLEAIGADIVDRSNGRFAVQDFLEDGGRYDFNVVTNPPYDKAKEIISHALDRVKEGRFVAALVQAKFLYSQGRHALFNRAEMEKVLIMSRRPSMPPGKMLLERGEACRGGGSIDFAWTVWRKGKTEMGATIEWVL